MTKTQYMKYKYNDDASHETQYMKYKYNDASHEMDVEVRIDMQVIPMIRIFKHNNSRK